MKRYYCIAAEPGEVYKMWGEHYTCVRGECEDCHFAPFGGDHIKRCMRSPHCGENLIFIKVLSDKAVSGSTYVVDLDTIFGGGEDETSVDNY